MDPIEMAGLMSSKKSPAAGFGGKEVYGVSGDKNMSGKEKLTVLAKEFESVFLNRMLSAMRATVQKSGLIDGGQAEELFTGMLDEEMARQMAFSYGSGLSASLVEQLSANAGMTGSKASNEYSRMEKPSAEE